MAAEKKLLSRRFWQHAETKISAGVSRVTRPAELNEMVQYSSYSFDKEQFCSQYTIQQISLLVFA
jgi:hypothetical protein